MVAVFSVELASSFSAGQLQLASQQVRVPPLCIALAVFGAVLGGIVGSRIRRKIDLKKLSIDEYLSFKITQIIQWTNKNQKKLDQLWYAILVEKVR